MADPTIVRSTQSNQAPSNPFKQGGDPYQDMRNKAQQDAGNAQSQNLDAITRRFSAMGNMNSGAYVQAQQNAGREAAQQSQDQIGKINMQQQGVHDQAELQKMGLDEQNNEFRQAQGQQQAQFETEMPLKGRQLDLEASQQGMDREANQINEEMGKYQAAHSGGLLGGGGILGSGLGSGVLGSGNHSFF